MLEKRMGQSNSGIAQILNIRLIREENWGGRGRNRTASIEEIKRKIWEEIKGDKCQKSPVIGK